MSPQTIQLKTGQIIRVCNFPAVNSSSESCLDPITGKMFLVGSGGEEYWIAKGRGNASKSSNKILFLLLYRPYPTGASNRCFAFYDVDNKIWSAVSHFGAYPIDWINAHADTPYDYVWENENFVYGCNDSITPYTLKKIALPGFTFDSEVQTSFSHMYAAISGNSLGIYFASEASGAVGGDPLGHDFFNFNLVGGYVAGSQEQVWFRNFGISETNIYSNDFWDGVTHLNKYAKFDLNGNLIIKAAFGASDETYCGEADGNYNYPTWRSGYPHYSIRHNSNLQLYKDFWGNLSPAMLLKDYFILHDRNDPKKISIYDRAFNFIETRQIITDSGGFYYGGLQSG